MQQALAGARYKIANPFLARTNVAAVDDTLVAESRGPRCLCAQTHVFVCQRTGRFYSLQHWMFEAALSAEWLVLVQMSPLQARIEQEEANRQKLREAGVLVV